MDMVISFRVYFFYLKQWYEFLFENSETGPKQRAFMRKLTFESDCPAIKMLLPTQCRGPNPQSIQITVYSTWFQSTDGIE